MYAQTLPPSWLQAWRRVVRALMVAEMHLLRFMCQTVRLGLRKRSWLSHQDPAHQRLTDDLIENLNKACEHPPHMLAKSGNKYGSFQKCMQCATRWKWVLGAWEELPSSPSPRPLPRSDPSGARPILATKLAPTLTSSTSSSSGYRQVTGLKPKAKPEPRRRGELDFTEAEVRSMNLHKGAPSAFARNTLPEEALQNFENHFQRGVAARRAYEETEQEELPEKTPSEYAWDLVDDP